MHHKTIVRNTTFGPIHGEMNFSGSMFPLKEISRVAKTASEQLFKILLPCSRIPSEVGEILVPEPALIELMDKVERGNTFHSPYRFVLANGTICYTKTPFISSRQLWQFVANEQDFHKWLSSATRECDKMNNQCPMFARKISATRDIHFSSSFALFKSLKLWGYRNLLLYLPLLDGLAGYHSKRSMARELSVSARMLPDVNGRVDLQSLHSFLRVPEPYEVWSEFLTSEHEMELGEHYFRMISTNPHHGVQPVRKILVTENVAMAIAACTPTVRGRSARECLRIPWD
jgi:phage anti-repressor protein